MRIVIDTNIMVSAYLGSTLKIIINLWKSGKFTLIVSDAIIDEYSKVSRRPKFQIESEELDDFFALILDRAEFVIPTEKVNVIAEDSSDDKFLDAAMVGDVDFIVSGDKHLLALKSLKKSPLLKLES